MQKRGEQCPSALRLDEWLAGELTPAEGQSLEQHLEGCAACRSRRAERLESRRSFADAAPRFAALERSARRSSLPWIAGASALAAAAALALAVGAPWRTQSWAGAGSGTRAKGTPASLGWVVRRGARVFAPSPEERLRPGDALRFTVSVRERVYVAILGLDAAGRLSVYHPDAGEPSELGPGRDQPLPTAIALDATPGDERLYGVFCRTPASTSELQRAIGLAPDAPVFPAGCSYERRTLYKETP